MADRLCAELVARCMAVRTAAHLAHFTTRSYAVHVALDEFYTGLLEATDRFAECHMGVEGPFEDFPAAKVPTGAPKVFMMELHAWLVEHRTACADGSTELANLVDELLAVIDRSYYKIAFLK